MTRTARRVATGILALLLGACGGERPTTDAGGADGGETDEPDGTPPGPVTELTAAAGENQVALSWTDPDDRDLAAVELSWAPGTGGAILVAPGEQAYTATALANDAELTFTAVAVDASGNRSEAATVTATPRDATGPRNVFDVSALPGDGEVALFWREPGDHDLAGVEVSWSPGGAPPARVEAGLGAIAATGLTNGTEHTFTLVAVDDLDNPAAGVTRTATPTDAPPAPSLSPEDDTGALDGVTERTSGLTIRGADLPPGFAVRVMRDGTEELAATAVDETGAWSVDVDLPEGTHAITADLLDGAGERLWTSGVLELWITRRLPPRLLRPRSGANTGADRTPTFRWTPLEAGETVEIQADDDPSFASPDHEWTGLTGTSFEPSAELAASDTVPVGTRHYLRIRRVAEDGTPGPWSDGGPLARRHYVNVGRVDADFDGDGFSDVASGAWASDAERGRVHLYFGSDTGVADAPDLTVSGEPGARLGYSVAFAGDVNADGFADLLVGAPAHPDGARAYLFHGGPRASLGAALAAGDAAETLRAPTAGTSFGFEVAGAGDVDGDGRSDFLVGAYADGGAATPEATAWLYRAAGTAPHPLAIAGAAVDDAADADGGPGTYLALGALGDVDGDALGDVVVASPTWSAGRGRVEVHLGRDLADGTRGAALVLEGGEAGEGLGRSAAGGGDFTGDGYDDLIVGSEVGHATVYAGGPAMDATADVSLAAPSGPSDPQGFGRAVAAIGDFQGDGAEDVAVGAPNAVRSGRTDEGWVLLYFGGAAADGDVDRGILGLRADSRFGFALASPGDVDGDGLDDVVIGAPGDHTASGSVGDGRVHLLLGRDGPIPGPNQSLVAPGGDGSGGRFGFSVGAGR